MTGALPRAQVDQAMPRDVARGLSSVKRFVREHRIGGVHGTLIELFQCAPQLYTAVEVRSPSAIQVGGCFVQHRSVGHAQGMPWFWEVVSAHSSTPCRRASVCTALSFVRHSWDPLRSAAHSATWGARTTSSISSRCFLVSIHGCRPEAPTPHPAYLVVVLGQHSVVSTWPSHRLPLRRPRHARCVLLARWVHVS